MPIPDPPPDPTYFRVLLRDPEGNDTVEIQRLLEDCGLRVMRLEELSWNDAEREAKKPSEKAAAMPRQDRKVG